MRKPSLIKLFLVLFTTLFMASSCSTDSGSDAAAADTLKSFYQSYIRENAKMPFNQENVTALQKKHCTAAFLSKLESASLEADPFLNAQDVEEKWADNLEVNADESGKNNFKVCYTASFDNAKHCVQVAMVKEAEQWMIDQVSF